MKLSGLSVVALILIIVAVSSTNADGKIRKRCVMCQPFEVCNDLCRQDCESYFAGVGKCVSKTQCECRVGEDFCSPDLRRCNVTKA